MSVLADAETNEFALQKRLEFEKLRSKPQSEGEIL